MNDWSTVSGIDLKVSIDLDEDYFTATQEVPVFSMIQEAFTNIRKHSNANCTSIWFRTNLKKWELIIEDNGGGFLINEIPLNKYGLVMLKERVHKIGATIDISSEIDQGTNLIIKGSRE